MINICEDCGKEFKTRLRNQKYCDKICLSNAIRKRRIIVECATCSKPKVIEKYEFEKSKTGKFYCNKLCYDKSQRGGIDNYIIECGNCGSVIERTPFEFNKYEHHFCDKKCYDEWQEVSGHTRGENSPRFNSIVKKCDYSGCCEEIKVSPCQIKGSKRQFCSYKCRAAWVSENLSGINSPRWSGGYNEEDYGPEFNKDLKRSVYKRDGYKCKLCGKKRSKQRLCAHHIDYDKKNNAFVEIIEDRNDLLLNNLITLCDSCHTRTNHNRWFWKRWFNSSSSFWFAARCQ